MSTQIMLIHDGSTIADKAIFESVGLAKTNSVGLYVLAIVAGSQSSDGIRTTSSSDRLLFAKLSRKFGVEISGATLPMPTESKLRSIIVSEEIVHVVISSDQLRYDHSRSGQLLAAFAKNCPVPITISH